MCLGEVARLVCRPELVVSTLMGDAALGGGSAGGSEAAAAAKAAGSPVEFEIMLRSINPAQASPAALLVAARVARARTAKERGTALLKGGDHSAALRKYAAAARLLRGLEGEDGAAATEAAAVHNNAALCNLKLRNHAAVC